jgi:hypothetical protein
MCGDAFAPNEEAQQIGPSTVQRVEAILAAKRHPETGRARLRRTAFDITSE